MKKRKLSLIGYWLLFALAILIVVIVVFVQYFFYLHVEEVHEIKETPNYVLKVAYPVVKNKTISKKIEKYVEDAKKDFILSIEDNVDPNYQYDFTVNYDISVLGTVKMIHLVIYSFTGGAHYIRNDQVFMYDEDTGKEVDITYFLENDTFSKLQELARAKIYAYYEEKDESIDKTWIDDGTSKPSDFSLFKVSDNEVIFTFPPYQVGPWSDGEIVISIPKASLNGVFKNEYLNYEEEKPVISTIQNKRDLSEFKDKKLIAFTFDDGPGGKSTSKLLDNLDKYNARVTFFVLGSRVNTFSENLRRAYLMGNTIGSHTFNHFNLYKLSEEAQMEEIVSTNKAIESVIGQKTIYLRPPYGNIKNEIKEQSGMYTILWNIDTEDWKKKNADKIADHIIEHAHDGAIVLLHDIYMFSVDGALKAMEVLQKEGYAFVTIEEMLELKGKTLEPLKSYYGF